MRKGGRVSFRRYVACMNQWEKHWPMAFLLLYFWQGPFRPIFWLSTHVRGKAANVHVSLVQRSSGTCRAVSSARPGGVASADRPVFFFFSARLFNSSASAKLKKMVYLLYLRRAVQILASDDTAHSAGDACMLAASRGGEFMTRLETAAHKPDRRAADCGNDFHVASRRLPRTSILALGARTTSHVPSLILSACLSA